MSETKGQLGLTESRTTEKKRQPKELGMSGGEGEMHSRRFDTVVQCEPQVCQHLANICRRSL